MRGRDQTGDTRQMLPYDVRTAVTRSAVRSATREKYDERAVQSGTLAGRLVGIGVILAVVTLAAWPSDSRTKLR